MAEIGLTEVAATVQDLVDTMVQNALIQVSQLVPTVINKVGVKGQDSLLIPRRSSALAPATKAENTALSLQELTFATDALLFDKHKAIAVSIEDIANMQSNIDVKAQVIDEMARELALQVDEDILACLKAASAAAPDHRVLFSNSPTNTILQTDILEARKLLNDQKVPQENRWMLVPPAQEKSMLLISDFVRADAYGSPAGLVNGEIGRVYGFRVLMGKYTALADTEVVFWNQEAVAYGTQLGAKFEEQRQVLKLSTEMVLSVLYGCKTLDSGKRQVLYNSTGA
jgi:hypothetical protein